MRKIICLILCILFVLNATACKDNKPSSTTPTPSVNVYEENNVTVSTSEFPENTVLKVETVEKTVEIEEIFEEAKDIEVYDINAFLDEEKIQPSSEVKVTFPAPKEFDSLKHTIEVYYIADDGTTEKIDSAIVDGNVVVNLKHFSVYAVIVVEKVLFNLAIDSSAIPVDGKKVFVSDNNVSFEFSQGDTWETFVERNKDKGFSIGKDFYGKKDLVYYTTNGIKYQVVQALFAFEVNPTDLIDKGTDYATIYPQQEDFQCQWLYEISTEEFMVPGYLDPFHKNCKELLLDRNSNTYTIKTFRLQKLAGGSYILLDELSETGTYTSTDGTLLGSTLTLSNGYVLKTTRSDAFTGELTMGDKTITVRADEMNRFMN